LAAGQGIEPRAPYSNSFHAIALGCYSLVGKESFSFVWGKKSSELRVSPESGRKIIASHPGSNPGRLSERAWTTVGP
jgi:hypothetical protein